MLEPKGNHNKKEIDRHAMVNPCGVVARGQIMVKIAIFELEFSCHGMEVS